jgi:hypothetical protein
VPAAGAGDGWLSRTLALAVQHAGVTVKMRTTTDTYSHVMPAPGKEAAAKMGTALWGLSGTTWHQWPPRWHHGRLRASPPKREGPGQTGWS